MIFQWQLFVLLVVVGVFVYMMGLQNTVNSYGQIEKRYTLIPALVVAIPLIYLAGTRGDSLGDTHAYRSSFFDLPSSISQIPGYISGDMKDKGFAVFSIIIKTIFGNKDVIYFTIIAAICILCVTLTYKKYSCNFIMSIFLFIASGDYIQWTFNGIRQFIPVSILFASMGLILKKKYIPAIILILVLSTIHASALVMIPVIFIGQGQAWNKKTVALLVAAVFAITFVDQFTGLLTTVMENTQYSSEIDQFINAEGMNILRVIVYSIPALISLLFLKHIRKADNKLINLCVGMSIATMCIYLAASVTNGIFVGRIASYVSLYNYILLPWEIEHIFTKRSAILLYMIMIGFYMAFYYYQMHVAWGL